MNCVTCKSPMIVVERNNVELDYCIYCKALWFDSTELEILSKHILSDTKIPPLENFSLANTKEKIRMCPRCNANMDKIEISNNPQLIIDVCPKKHGIWFDYGELEDFFEHIKKDGETLHPVINFLGEMIGKNKGGEK